MNKDTLKKIWGNIKSYVDNGDNKANTNISNLNANTGISDYKKFSDQKEYKAGETVLKDGLLKTFITGHAAGAWDESEVRSESLKKNISDLENTLYPVNHIPYGEINNGQTLEVNWKNDTALDNNGNERRSSGYSVTDYIEYNNNYNHLFCSVQVSFNNYTTSFINVAYYDTANKVFIKGFQCFGNDRIILIPKGMCIRIVQKTSVISDIIFSSSVAIKDIKSLINERISNVNTKIVSLESQVNDVESKSDSNSTNIEHLNSELYSTVEEDITSMFVGNNAYKTVIGSQPTLATNSYKISGQIFDSSKYKGFKLHSKGAGTYRLWAKVKNDVVTEMASYSADFVDVEIYFDGTFDKIVINNYGGTVIGISDVSIIDETEKLLQKDVEEDITQQIMAETTAYTTVVGKAPSKNDEISTQFGIKGKIFDVTDIKSFTLHSQSEGTCRLWAKIKNGRITEMASDSASVVDITIENDGTFDKLVINLYHGTAVILKTVLFTDYIDSQIDNFKDEVSSLKTEIDTLQNSKTLKILMFGNSFTHDSAGYVPFILKSMYPNLNLELGIAFYNGCSLAQHLASLSGQNVTLDEQNITPQTYMYSLNINGGKWTTNYRKDGTDIIKVKDWDIITFQQNGKNAFSNWNTYFKPFIYKIQKLIYEKVNKPVKLGWVLTHGSYAGTDLVTLKKNWQGTADNSQKVIQNSLADFIMPYGTAVQNLRNVYDSSWGGQADLLGDDNVHMQEGLPCLTAAYCYTIKILELVGLPLSIIGNKLEPTKEWVEEYALGPNYYKDDVMSVDDSNRFIAQACAIQAIKNPYTITDISEIINNL